MVRSEHVLPDVMPVSIELWDIGVPGLFASYRFMNLLPVRT